MNLAFSPLPREPGSRGMLLCFSHLRWNFVFQRPQHLLTRAARVYDVFYWEEPVFEDIAAPRLHREQTPDGVERLVPQLPHMPEAEAIAAQRQLLQGFLAAGRKSPSVLWYYTPMALAFSREITADVIVYDNMDELSAFHAAPPEIVALENEMFAASDIVFTGGQSLFEAKRHRHHNIHAFPSSIDTGHFHQARQTGEDPADQAEIGRVRLGFAGVVDERMDLDLLAQAADLRPDWQFVMIGPVVKVDPATLPRRGNIHWLGSRDYKRLPEYLRHWDIGMMPFALNESTRFISPTKTPEFLAAGLPVVSTRIRDVVRPYGDLGLVEIVDGAQDFCAKAEQLLLREEQARDRQTWLETVDAFLARNSWSQTFDQMHRLMQDATSRRMVKALLEVQHV
jgi:glycosyltransferase involved in cell wall biosynthesis